MNDLNPNDPTDREFAWITEANRLIDALPIIRQYERGLYTFDEFLARLTELSTKGS